MPNLTKQDMRDLRKKAKECPLTYQERRYKKAVTGQQLMDDVEKSGDEDLIKRYQTIFDSQDFKPFAVYDIEYSEQLPVNHYHRMKKMFKKAKTREEGMEALNEYLDAMFELKHVKVPEIVAPFEL